MREHQDAPTTTEDIASVDEPRAEGVDSDRTEADRVDEDRIDAGRVDADRIDEDRIDTHRVDADGVEADRGQSTRVASDRVTVDEPPRPGGHDPETAADVLFDEAETVRFRERWRELQGQFVDDSQRAVRDADVLVAELMQELASAFSERKRLLEDQWREGSGVQTEDLRLALRGYRSFLDQLLAH
jgi:hypothetical protein